MNLTGLDVSESRIVVYPDNSLKEPSQLWLQDIRAPTMQGLIAHMIKTMNEFGALGLAAVQVGLSVAVMVVRGEKDVMVFVNPTIVPLGDSKTYEKEGCLSLPGVYV